MSEKIKPFRSTLHFPECRRKMKICKAATFFPISVVALSAVVGTIIILIKGGISIVNDEANYLFGTLVMWSIITAIPSACVIMGYKIPCFPAGLAFALMAAFIENTALMITSFLGVMSCVIAFFYICEMDDLKNTYGYPSFREDCEFEYLRTTKSIIDAESERLGETKEETEEISEETEETSEEKTEE
ncbi:MAG: hypothetical protein IJY83_00255 [Oscillospiraceae bacterium]|nr:hypothetical protein [Oscillospiraceae bacterium]